MFYIIACRCFGGQIRQTVLLRNNLPNIAPTPLAKSKIGVLTLQETVSTKNENGFLIYNLAEQSA